MYYYNEMKEKGLPPTSDTYRALLRCAAQLGRHETVTSLFDKMQHFNSHPDTRIFVY